MDSIEVAAFVVVKRPDGTHKLYEGDHVSGVETLELLVSAVAQNDTVRLSVDGAPAREIKRSRLRGRSFKDAVRTLTEEIANERKIGVA